MSDSPNLTAPDYQTLAARYERIKRIAGRSVRKLSQLYPDQTHFIYELVQNAADVNSPTLHFLLRDGGLRVWNRGRAFTEADIEAICSVDETTKDLTQIGTHGIGFKAVYIWTDAPQIHSGPHHFRIRDYVEREELTESNAEISDLVARGRTVFELPFKARLPLEARDKLSHELRHIDPWTLLFLHGFTDLNWQDECQPGQGIWRRAARPHPVLPGTHIVGLYQGVGSTQAQVFLVFEKSVIPPQEVIMGLLDGAETERERERISTSGHKPQTVEIAFAFREGRIQSQEDSVLFSYLPTKIQTGLRFLIQARYQTIPTRENIASSRDSAWNEWLIRETAAFLPNVLERLRDAGLLTPTVLDALPNSEDKARIGGHVLHVFNPIMTDLLAALKTGALVPTMRHDFLPSAHVFAPHRTELADLFSAADLSGVAGAEWLDPGVAWSGRAGTLLREAGVQVINAKQVSHWLATRDAAWFESRESEWLERLYRYLVTQRPEWAALKSLPLVRLRDGSHTAPTQQVLFFPPEGDEGDVALSSYMEGLPILSADTDLSASGGEVRSMLAAWGVKPPKPADVIEFALLTEHRTHTSTWTIKTLHAHLHLLVKLMTRLGEADRQRLLPSLSADFTLVAHTRADEGKMMAVRPKQTYLPPPYTGNNDLEHYFLPSPATMFLHPDDLGPNVDREATVRLLRDMGVADLPRLEKGTDSPLTWNEEYAIQGRGKTVECVNWRLDGLTAVLEAIREAADPEFGLAQVLWRTLQRVRTRRGAQYFEGKYRWQYYSVYERAVDPTFVRQLKEASWLPDQGGILRRPDQLHADTPDNRRLLGDSVNYLHAAFALTEKNPQQFAEWLGVHLTATPNDVYGHLEHLSGRTGDPAQAELLYRFLARYPMEVKEAFVGKPWVLTRSPGAPWRTVGQVFWKDESAVFGDQRGYLDGTYPASLKPFFVSIGVPAEATLRHYLDALEECAWTGRTDADTRQRLHTLYKRLWLHLQAAEDGPGGAEHGHWRRVMSGRNWLGLRGSEWGFYDRSALVVPDVEYIGNLFADRLPFWNYGDLTKFAEQCGVERCSTAVRTFHPVGATEAVLQWSQRLGRLVPYIRAFLHPQSPRLSAARNENADSALLGRLVVRRTERALVEYTLKGETVEDETPRPSHLDLATDSLWLAHADEEEYPDLIGDALHDHFGTAQLGQFVSQLLSCAEGRMEAVLQRWQRKGLNLGSVGSSDEESIEAEGDPESPASTSWEAADVSDTTASEADEWDQPEQSQAPGGGYAASPPTPTPINDATDAPPVPGQNAPAASPPSAAEPVDMAKPSLNGGEGGKPHGHFAFSSRSGGGDTGGHGHGGTGREGQYHIRLKAHLARNSSILGPGLTLVQEEYRFNSGDKVDILFLDPVGSPVTVEVEAAISPGELYGIWQASRYQHWAAADYGRPCRSVRTVVVAPSFPDDAHELARKLGVECFVHPLLPPEDGRPVQE